MKVLYVKCPICGNSSEYRVENLNRPFCSKRCKMIDLGAWADERYAVPGAAVPDAADIPQNNLDFDQTDGPFNEKA